MTRFRSLGRSLCWLLVAVVGVRALSYMAYAAWMLPFELETFYLEGKTVHLCQKVLLGLPLYPDPNAPPFEPNRYTPLYPMWVGWLSSLFSAQTSLVFVLGRLSSFAATLLGSAVLGLGLWRCRGPAVAGVGVLASLGAAPLLGFSVMARADALSEVFGFAGFAVVVWGRTRWKLVCGALLLGCALLTKQTAGVFLAATALWLFLQGARLRASLLFAATLGASLGVLAIYGWVWEPHLLRSIFGSGGDPYTLQTFKQMLVLALQRCPELLLLPLMGTALAAPAVGFRGAPQVLSVVLLGASLATIAKTGSDLNYFLPLRLVAGLWVAELFHQVRQDRAARAGWLVLALLAAVLACLQGSRAVLEALDGGDVRQRYATQPEDPRLLAAYREAMAIAADPQVRLYTNSSLLAAYQQERAEVVDPFLFWLRVARREIDIDPIKQAIVAQRYDFVILTRALDDPNVTFMFGVPPPLVQPFVAHYELVGRGPSLFFYAPKRSPSP